jgi:hypothetical protein
VRSILRFVFALIPAPVRRYIQRRLHDWSKTSGEE